MSLVRTAARLAAVMTLANGFTAPWPTMAHGRVFDSRPDPRQLVDVASDDVLPMITVCTDDDRGDGLSENNGGPPFRSECTLVIEISLAMIGEVEGRPGDPEILLPRSEPELEAMLDLLEWQVQRAFADPTNRWAAQFQAVTRSISGWSSTRFVERDGNVRLAARSIAATVGLAAGGLVETAPASGVPAPLGPLLAAIIGAGGPFAPAATALRDLLLDQGASAPVTLPKLLRIRLIEAEQAETNGAGTPRGPRAPGVAQANVTGH